MNLDVLLVPVDFSEVSQIVYETAMDLASRLSSRVVLLKVTEPEIDYVGIAPSSAYLQGDEQIAKIAESRLEAGAEAFRARGIPVEIRHHWGPIVRTILEEVEKQKAGLIVLGSHGHGALYNLLMGSVAEGVVRHAKVPVVVVPDMRARS